MNYELIGTCGTGQMPGELKRILRELRLGIAYLSSVFPEPYGCALDIVWTECEYSGSSVSAYPSIGLVPEEPLHGLVDLACRMQNILATFDQAVNWDEIDTVSVADRHAYELEESGLISLMDKDDDGEEDNEDDDDEDGWRRTDLLHGDDLDTH